MSKEYQPMLCPVCGDFYFSELQEGDNSENFWCSRCGWHYDIEQTNMPYLKNGANSMSLNEYKKWFAKKKAENPEYDYLDENMPTPIKHMCPICGKYEFKDECCFDICPHCGWEDDGTEDDAEIIGANDLRFSLYKKRYEGYLSENPNYKWEKDGRP